MTRQATLRMAVMVPLLCALAFGQQMEVFPSAIGPVTASQDDVASDLLQKTWTIWSCSPTLMAPPARRQLALLNSLSVSVDTSVFVKTLPSATPRGFPEAAMLCPPSGSEQMQPEPPARPPIGPIGPMEPLPPTPPTAPFAAGAAAPSSTSVELARVVFQSDSSHLLQSIRVEIDDPSSLRVELDDLVDQLGGLLLGEIQVDPSAMVLSKLSTRGFTKLVVQENIFVHPGPPDELSIVTTSQSKVFVALDHDDVLLHSLVLRTVDLGSIQLQVGSLSVATLTSITVGSTGQVIIKADSFDSDDSVQSVMNGFSTLCMQTMTMNVRNQLKVVAHGTNQVLFGAQQGNGHCAILEGVIDGTSQVDLGTITCDNASLTVPGMAKVLVQVVDTLSLHDASLVSDVHYVGNKPRAIQGLPSVFFEMTAARANPVTCPLAVVPSIAQRAQAQTPALPNGSKRLLGSCAWRRFLVIFGSLLVAGLCFLMVQGLCACRRHVQSQEDQPLLQARDPTAAVHV